MTKPENTERIVDGLSGDHWRISNERISFEILNSLGEHEETAFVYWGKDNLLAIISALASFLKLEEIEKLVIDLMSARIKAKNESISDEKLEEIIGLFKAREG